MEIKYSGLSALTQFLKKCRETFASITHTHTKSEITDFPTIPTKTSQLTNDSGFKTTDNNTTYSISKSGNTITLTGSDGSSTSVTDSDTKVTNTLATTTKAYVTGTTSSKTNTGTLVFDTGVYLDTSTGELTATTFKGNLAGKANSSYSADEASHAFMADADDNGDIIRTTYETKSDASSKLSTAKSYSDTNLATAKSYTDTKIDAIVGEGASETLDTIGEISKAIEEHQDVTDALNAAIGTKANASDLTSHTGNTTVHLTSTERTNWNTAYAHSKATHARTDATKVAKSDTNGNILINGTETTVYTHPSGTNPHGTTKADVGLGNVDNTADSAKTVKAAATLTGLTATVDELNYTDGVTSNIQTQLNGKAASSHTHSSYVNQNAFSNFKVGDVTIAADTTTDTLTVVAGSNITLTPDADNDKLTIAATNTTYSAGTGISLSGTTFSNSGVRSISAGSNGIIAVNTGGTSANVTIYTLPTASSTLGGVKTTSTVTSNSGYTACPIIEGVPYYKDTNTTYSLSSFGITATATELNALDGITATVTELNYVDGVTSNIQTQINNIITRLNALEAVTHTEISSTEVTDLFA